ncbi:MAG: flagellar hook basal-body protein [Gemmatales bacterium]|nr:flagellar hook basal-body protein [Gemmatales bacterium]MDW7994327.1 flagellar hook basal-body protein [Gemmatales bacterium]
MLSGFYSAATALERAHQHHELVAFNLAHANVPGYRQRISTAATFEAVFQLLASSQVAERLGVKSAPASIDLTPGPLEYTGAPLDLAIRGPGFFVVEGPNGMLYTRVGTLSLNAARELVIPGGYPILGIGGRITIPENVASVTVLQDGTVFANGQPVGQMRLVEVSDARWVEPVGATLFRIPESAIQEARESSVLQGFRESSNVNIVAQLVQLIAGFRHFEAAQRALRTLAESLHWYTRPSG